MDISLVKFSIWEGVVGEIKHVLEHEVGGIGVVAK
jgi:hypothetical protein